MKRGYLKMKEFKNGIVKDVQVRLEIQKDMGAYVIAEYKINGVTETKAILKDEISPYPITLEFL